MLLLRSLTVGLLGACVVLLARLQSVPHGLHHDARMERCASAPMQPRATIVDVAPGVVDVAALVTLAPGERVVAIDDRPVGSDLAAGARIAAAPRGPGRFLDLTIEAQATSRRVLVLMH